MQTKSLAAFCVIISLLTLAGCGGREKITDFSQLAQAEFAVPTGTVADQLVASRFPEARFEYYNSVLDAALAVRSGKADAAA
jgi:polar amino acid transport system substrate-binding protein